MTESYFSEPGALPLHMDLAELETFVCVVELGSFSLAAQRMHKSQPSITARIQRLEERLQTQLLRRTTRSLELTRPGCLVFDTASKTLQELRRMVKALDAAEGRGGHRVVVAATPMIAATTLPVIINAYGQRYPDVRVRLLDLQYDEVIEHLESESVDLAVMAFDGDPLKLEFRPLAQEALVLVAPAKHPLAACGEVTLEQLAGYPLLMLQRYSELTRAIDRECALRGLSIARPHQAANLNTLLGMIDAGNGLAFLPRSMAQINARQERALLHVADMALTRRYGIVLPRDGTQSSAARSFCEFLQRHYAQARSGELAG
jgi:DNA-binding transcriptional LysR family regulator